ncbi:Short C-terminal domain-containing protein [Riemerella columbipharyngis]|uniref:Short C-terminal domain-containing protein n=2 Tax=Riemerella columbipharyngis TaxID=1071918 RepID=A0A1G7FI16_9FLAO|nr:Short C-terminal domain-containing protein [Riemerella columbipharyngis]
MQKISEAKQDKVALPQSYSKMDELKKLGELKETGVLTEEEFQKEKERILKDS